MQRLLLTALLLGSTLCLSSCGIISHQISRATNLLRVPVRVGQAIPPLDGADHRVHDVA